MGNNPSKIEGKITLDAGPEYGKNDATLGTINDIKGKVDMQINDLNIALSREYDVDVIWGKLQEQGFFEEKDNLGNVFFSAGEEGNKKAAIYCEKYGRFLRFGVEKDLIVDEIQPVVDLVASLFTLISLVVSRNGVLEVYYVWADGNTELLADGFESYQQAEQESYLLSFNKTLSFEQDDRVRIQILEENGFKSEPIGPEGGFILYSKETPKGIQKVLGRAKGAIINFSGSFFVGEFELYTKEHDGGVSGAIVQREGKYYYYRLNPFAHVINDGKGVDTREEINQLIRKLYGSI